jgi:tRNA pseudouridine38-40 synthase
MSHRYFIILQYNGKNFQGWQIQDNGPTVQSELNQKLSILLKEKIETTGAGRTDSGVHAKYFVAHFDISQNINETAESLIHKLNRFLSRDIRIISIKEVANKAHARFDAISRTYKYFISTRKEVFKKDYVWVLPYTPDIEIMNVGAEILKEYKDFTSFSRHDSNTKTNFCDIMSAEWQRKDDLFIFSITADRFLRNMVRAIVGTLVDLGRHKITIDEFRKVIEACNRSMAGESVPASGLFLWDIVYPYKI